MALEILRLLRNILLRSFVVGLGFMILMGLLVIFWWNPWIAIASSWLHTDVATLTPLVLEFLSTVRLVLLLVFLIPGIAIHWTLKRELAK